MPSDMGSRKLGSGRYRGLDEESHMPGFQNPTHGPTCGPNSMKPSIFGVSNSVNNQFKKRTHHVVSTTWHLVFLPFHTKKTCIDGCLSSHSCRKTRRSDDSDPSLFFLEVVTSQFSRRFRMLQAWWDSQLAMPWQVRLRIKQSFHAQRQGADAASQHVVMLLKSHRRSKLDCRRHSWHPKNPSIIHRKSVKIPQNPRKSLKIFENPWKLIKWQNSIGSFLGAPGASALAYDNWMGFSCHAQRPLSFWLHHQASSSRQKQPVNSAKPSHSVLLKYMKTVWYDISYFLNKDGVRPEWPKISKGCGLTIQKD